MTSACRSWSAALDAAAQKFDIVSWGRELETGRGTGIVRLSVAYFKDKHLRALIHALEVGYEHVTELSIHFNDSYVADISANTQDPFAPEGCHNTYLAWIGMEPQNALAAPSGKKTVYDRLSSVPGSVHKDAYPKDTSKTTTETNLDLAAANKKRNNTISIFPKLIARYVPLMPNLYLVAFYGMQSNLLNKVIVKNIFTAIARASSTYKALDGVIFRNCPLGDDMFKTGILSLSTAISVRLLVVHTCDLTDESAGAIGAVLTAHKNARDNRLWELCLKKYGPTLKESGSNRSKTGFSYDQLQKIKCMHELKGMVYLDLGYNQFGNELCKELLDSLKDDTYLHSISLDGNTNIRLVTSVMLPRHDNGDLNYIYDNIMTLSKHISDPNKSPKSGVKAGDETHLSIRMSERISQLDLLSHAPDALTKAEQIVLQSICPDYEPSAKSTILSYLASYSRSTDDLKTLMTLKAHPLVQLLLQNNTILHLLLDSSTTPTLLRFVNSRLSANRKIANTCLLDDADKVLSHEKDVSDVVEDLREQENLRGMVKRLQLASDPINFLASERPLAMEYDQLTPRRRSRRGKSISQIHAKIQGKLNAKEDNYLYDDLSDNGTPPVDRDERSGYPLSGQRHGNVPSTPTRSRAQSAGKVYRATSTRRSGPSGINDTRYALTSSAISKPAKAPHNDSIYYSNVSSGFNNYAKGPMPFDTRKRVQQRPSSTGKRVVREDSDDIPVTRRNKPDPFVSKNMQRRPNSQKKALVQGNTSASANTNSTVKAMHMAIDQATPAERRAGRSVRKPTIPDRPSSGQLRTGTPKGTRAAQKRVRSAVAQPIHARGEMVASQHKDAYESTTSDDGAKYDVIYSPKKPVYTSTSSSKSTSLVQLSQGIPVHGKLHTSPHTRPPRQVRSSYTTVDASALSEIEPVRSSNSPINKPTTHGSGIEQSDFCDVNPRYDSSRDSFERALHANIDTVRLEHYAPPVLTEPSSTSITQKDKNRIYKRLLKDIASSAHTNSETNDTDAELRELSAKAKEIIQNSRVKETSASQQQQQKYTYYPQDVNTNNNTAAADELHVDELLHSVSRPVAIDDNNMNALRSSSKRVDPNNIELQEIDQLLSKTQNIGEELDKSYKKISSLYAETMRDIYGPSAQTAKNERPAVSEPKQVDLGLIDHLLINNSPPKPSAYPTRSLAEKLTLSKMAASGTTGISAMTGASSTSKWSAYSTTAATNDELLKSVDDILGEPQLQLHGSHYLSDVEDQFDGSRTSDLSISSMKDSIKAYGNTTLNAHMGDYTFESIISLLYTVLMYFTKSNRVEALQLYKANEARIIEYVEEILMKLKLNELKLDNVSSCLYELVSSFMPQSL